MNIPKRYKNDRYIIGSRAGKVVARANFMLDENGELNLMFPEHINFSYSFWQGFYCYLVFDKKLPVDKIKINGGMNEFTQYTQGNFTKNHVRSRMRDYVPVFLNLNMEKLFYKSAK